MAKLKTKSNRFPRLIDQEIQLASTTSKKANLSSNRKFFYFIAFLSSFLLLAFVFSIGNLSPEAVSSIQVFLDAIPFADLNFAEHLVTDLKFPGPVSNTLSIAVVICLGLIVFDATRKDELAYKTRSDLLRESSSASYSIHILILLLMLASILLSWKPKPKVKVTSIEYIPTQVPSKKKPPKKVTRKAAKQSINQGKSKPKQKPKPVSKPAGKVPAPAKPKPRPKPQAPAKPVSQPAPKPVAKPIARPKPQAKPRPVPKLNRPAINQAQTTTKKPLPKLMNYGSQSSLTKQPQPSSSPSPKTSSSTSSRSNELVSMLSNIPRAPETSGGSSYGMPGAAGAGGASGAAGNPGANQYPDRAPSLAAQADIDFGPYMSSLQRKIKRAWKPPRGTESNRIVVTFSVRRDGSLADLKLSVKSPYPDANLAALDAVSRAAPFDRLPSGACDLVDIEFTFDYNVFQRSR